MTYNFPPDRRGHGSNNIDKAHLVILRMLTVLAKICNRHHIDFWLDYGTLLGAVRHRGFIPWDYEADIGMLRPDFEKFCKIIQKDLPEDIFFQTKETDPDYLTSSYYIEGKLRDKYSSYPSFSKKNPQYKWHNGIQVDIFVYDVVQLDGETCIMNHYEKLLTGGQSFFTCAEIEELIECQFEEAIFFIPKGYDTYLKRNYSEYMILPPVEARQTEDVDVFCPCNHKEILHWKNKAVYENQTEILGN